MINAMPRLCCSASGRSSAASCRPPAYSSSRCHHPDRAEAVAGYEQYLLGRPELVAQLPDLRGRQLACYSDLDQPCHADVLCRLANDVAIAEGS